jgi:hypothetical protein
MVWPYMESTIIISEPLHTCSILRRDLKTPSFNHFRICAETNGCTEWGILYWRRWLGVGSDSLRKIRASCAYKMNPRESLGWHRYQAWWWLGAWERIKSHQKAMDYGLESLLLEALVTQNPADFLTKSRRSWSIQPHSNCVKYQSSASLSSPREKKTCKLTLFSSSLAVEASNLDTGSLSSVLVRKNGILSQVIFKIFDSSWRSSTCLLGGIVRLFTQYAIHLVSFK